jgi:hypothetical protein
VFRDSRMPARLLLLRYVCTLKSKNVLRIYLKGLLHEVFRQFLSMFRKSVKTGTSDGFESYDIFISN